ncbi:hypothetical protein KCU73_g6628, partial [Aureobasidium melanogenum]
MPARTYSKTFVPLESNPQIFTSLAHNLGASPGLKFTEFYSLDDDDDSEPKKGEILAYILAFPTSEDYEDERAAEGEKDIDEPDSILDRLINTPASQRSHFLDTCSELEGFYAEAADQGNTQPPENGFEVDWHYTCFISSAEKHKLYELDGDRWGPLYHADIDPDLEDFDTKATGLIRKYFERAEEGKEVQFSVMALINEPSVF